MGYQHHPVKLPAGLMMAEETGQPGGSEAGGHRFPANFLFPCKQEANWFLPGVLETLAVVAASPGWL